MVCFKVDVREQGRGRLAVDGFRLEGFDSEMVQLSVGDFLVDDLVVWEYKTVSDFIGSMWDKSLFNEVFNQSGLYPFSFLIIQGDFNKYLYDTFFKLSKSSKKKYNNNVKEYVRTQKNVIDGAIRRCRTVCNVVNLSSEPECLNEIMLQSLKCLDFKGYGGVVRPSKDLNINPCKSPLMEIKGVGDKVSDRIIDGFGLTCLCDLTSICYDELLEVSGVTEDIANVFWKKVYGVEYDESERFD